MEKRKNGFIFILVFVILSLLYVSVYASSGIKAILVNEKTELKGGDEVVVTVRLDNYEEINKGVNVYKATLEYDKSVFEEVLESNFKTQNNWEELKFNKDTGEFIAIKKGGSKEPEEILQIALKVKENAKAGKENILIKDIIISEGKEDIIIEESKATVDIIQDQSNEPGDSGNQNSSNNGDISLNPDNSIDEDLQQIGDGAHQGDSGNQNSSNNGDISLNPDNSIDEDLQQIGDGAHQGDSGNQNSSNNGDISLNSDNSIDEDLQQIGDGTHQGDSGNQYFSNHGDSSVNSDHSLEEKLPQTGDMTNWWGWFTLILVEAGIVIVYINKDRRKKGDRKYRKMTILLIVGGLSLQVIGTVNAAASSFSSKGELNGDGQIDYTDVHLLELYLIHQDELTESTIKNADMNRDGNINVTDLSLLVKKIEKTLEYKVDLYDAGQGNYYPNKNDEVNLIFVGDVSYDAVIEKAIINNQEYQVKKADDTSIYTVNVGRHDTSGIKEYNFTEVLLNNGKRIDVDYTIKLDVLKDIPSIEKYTVNENIDDSKVNISFYLKDDDDSIKYASVEILNENNESIQNNDISSGDNEIEVALEDGKKYTVNFMISYDLDTNQLSEYEEKHTGTLQETKELDFIIDYQWKISNIATYKNGLQTTIFEKNEPIQLGFQSSNGTRFEPDFAVVNKKEYSVTKENQQYLITVDGIDQAGQTEINLEEVVLSNGKRFSLAEENSIPVTILKQKPEITEFDFKEDVNNGTLTTSFNLIDEEDTLTSSNIVLLDGNNQEIARKEVKSGENEITFNTSLSSKYNVKIIATYSLDDGQEIVDSVLLEQEIEAQPRTEIKKITSSKDYVEKGDNIILQFVIDTNKIENIEKIRVNNLECIATKLSEGNYQVTYTVDQESGVQELNTTKITYSDGKTADVNNKIKIEVLKDKPSIRGFVQNDNLNESKVVLDFDVVDEDNSFINGKAILKNKEDGFSEEQVIVRGKNSISFSVKEGKLYTLDIYGTYDRDSNTLEGHESGENKVIDEILDTNTIELVGNYQLNVSNVMSYKGDLESKYFNKTENIDIRFESTNSTIFKPEKVFINGEEYELEEQDNIYQTSISGFDESGKKEIIIGKVILSNTKELPVSENNRVDIEVLKDKPTATEFKYKEKDNNQIEATFNIVDQENTIQSGEVIVYDEDQNEIKKQPIASGLNIINFARKSSEIYSVKVVVSYDLDENTLESEKNEYKDQTLLQEEIVLSGDRKIEMKDVLDVTVYEKKTDYSGNVTYQEVNEIIYLYVKYYPDNYIAKVQMKDMPDFYAKLKGYRIENGKCYLIIDYDNVVQYTGDGQQQNKLEVLYGDVLDDTYAESNSFSSLMAKIKADPNGTFVLTRDYDASEYVGDGTSLAGKDFEFKGTIDGNGHTIKNLNAPLFNVLKKSTIKNLRLENIYFGNGSYKAAPLANTVYSGTNITNVHVKDLTIITDIGYEKIGGIVGHALGTPENPVTIKDSSVNNLKITSSGNQSKASKIGGIAGSIQSAVIEDSYVKGTIEGNSKVGGIVGEIYKWQPSENSSTIKHCISKVDITTTNGTSGGILGLGSKAVTLTQNISLSTGSNANRIYGSGYVKLDRTNVAMSESTLNENTEDNIKTISKDDFSSKILKGLDFSEDTWNLTNCSYEYLPTLNNDDPRNELDDELTSKGIYIPNHEILKRRKDYDPSKLIIYSNLYKLIPFYDSKYLVIDGKKISEDHILNQKLINSVLAFDAKKEVMMYLTEENYDDIKYIRIVFEDGTIADYDVTYKYKDTEEPTNMYGRIAMYKIDELGIEYNYNRYILKQDARIINELVTYIKSLEYDKDLRSFVDLESYDKRGYAVLKAYFNDVIRSEKNVKEFVMNLLANVDGYNVTQENDILNYVISKKVINNEKFKKVLFAYSYYSRFYGVEIGGTTVSDMMLFKTDIYNKNVKFNNVIDDFWAARYKSAHVVHLGYRDNLGPLLGIQSQGDLIERAVYALTDYEDANEWFTEYFSSRNLLTESSAKSYTDAADYRAWTQIKKQPKYIMNILTLPENSGYIVSAPGTFLIGSQMVYINDPSNQEQKNQLLAKMQNFGDQMANFYNNLLGIIDVSYLNKYADIQIDKNYVNVYGQQSNGKCTDPFHINFNDLLDEWFRASGASAYATDGVINYADTALNGYERLWTHEIGHNQSYKLFFKGNGFRPIGGNNNYNLGTEDYTDGHTSQNFGDGDVNWNLSYDYTPDKLITTNLTQDRINSLQEIDSYYKGMFEAIDLLDYIEAKAFLQLTPQEQAQVAVQIQYPNNNNHSTVKWKQLTAEEFEKMELKTVDDLWKNRITIRPGVNREFTQDGSGAYGSEGMYIRRWYQPYNDKGRTHSWGFTYTTWQMLGMAGYEEGYLNWFTGKSSTDLDAIKKITKDDSMTWEKFKKERYKLIEGSLDNIPYLDIDVLIEDYVNALKTDAINGDRNVTSSTNVRRINYHHLKRATNDFSKEVFSGENEIIHIATAEEFKEKLIQNQIGDGNTNYYIGNYVLDNDIDLSEFDGDTIIDGYFMGKLDGNGHKLIGNKVPIFNNIKFAYISNMIIEDSNINLDDVRNEKVGSLANIIEYSSLDGITMRNVKVSGKKETGALAGNITGSLVENTHVINTTVSGTDRVGAIAGYIDKAQMIECSANGDVSATGAAVGGFVGEIVNGSVIKDCYSKGKAMGSKDVGGFIGYVNQSSIINCFSNARAEGNDGIASFVGQTVNNSKIQNNITLVNQFKGYKFDGRTRNDNFVNFSRNYENEGNSGTSTLDRTDIDFNGKIDIVPEVEVKTENFYTETLGWNEEIWDFSKVSNGGIPKLRNSDPNDNAFAVTTYHIKSADEFISKIEADPYARFIIDNDIDFSSKDTIIDIEFKGILEGNNHKLSGNKFPIFNTLNKAKITGLILEGSTIKAEQDNVGVLAKTAINSEIENVHVIEAIIIGAHSKVGGIIGYVENSILKASSSNASISASGNNIGGLVGEITSSTIIENSYSSGETQGNQNVGGLVGNVVGSTIKYSYSNTSVNGMKGIAGFIGQSTGNSIIQNNISLGNQNNKHYKFDSKTENEQFTNYSANYEYKENRGKSTLLREGIEFDGKIGVVTKEQITSKEFYIETLGWDEEIWDLSTVTKEYTPKLKNLDPNETKAIGVYKSEIDSVDKFLTELKTHPNGEFTITADLDFSNKEYNVGSILIPGVFNGVIKGNGHTIKNLKNATIFEQFNGEVGNLNLDKFNYGAVFFTGINSQYVSPGQSDKTQSNIAVFAKKSLNATYSNMKFSKITMFGHDNVAVVVSVDYNSTFENINVSQAYVNAGKIGNGGGNQSSTFISEKIGGLIKNCYVQGELITVGNNNGGILGVANCEVKIENVISNIFAQNGNNEAVGTNGLFVGKLDQTSVIKNSVSLGATTASSIGIHKFVGIKDDISNIQNCYENKSGNGTSDANGSNIQEIDKEQLKNKDFYITKLNFDEKIWALDNILERHYTESVNAHGMGRPEDFPLMIFFGLK